MWNIFSMETPTPSKSPDSIPSPQHRKPTCYFRSVRSTSQVSQLSWSGLIDPKKEQRRRGIPSHTRETSSNPPRKWVNVLNRNHFACLTCFFLKSRRRRRKKKPDQEDVRKPNTKKNGDLLLC